MSMMKMTNKNLVYEYVLNSENGTTAVQISEALNMEIHTVNGLLSKLRMDGKLIKTHGARRADASIWMPNGKFYLVGHRRGY